MNQMKYVPISFFFGLLFLRLELRYACSYEISRRRHFAHETPIPEVGPPWSPPSLLLPQPPNSLLLISLFCAQGLYEFL